MIIHPPLTDRCWDLSPPLPSLWSEKAENMLHLTFSPSFSCLVIDNWFLWMLSNHVILKCSNLFSIQRSNDIKYCSFFLATKSFKGQLQRPETQNPFCYIYRNFTQPQQYIILYSLLILVKPRTDVWLECFYFSHVSDERKALGYVSCHLCRWKREHTS